MIYPARNKLPTARRGMLFQRGNVPGSKHHVSVKTVKDDKVKEVKEKEGDASIETDDTPYDTWLVAHGLVSLQ